MTINTFSITDYEDGTSLCSLVKIKICKQQQVKLKFKTLGVGMRMTKKPIKKKGCNKILNG